MPMHCLGFKRKREKARQRWGAPTGQSLLHRRGKGLCGDRRGLLQATAARTVGQLYNSRSGPPLPQKLRQDAGFGSRPVFMFRSPLPEGTFGSPRPQPPAPTVGQASASFQTEALRLICSTFSGVSLAISTSLTQPSANNRPNTLRSTE